MQRTEGPREGEPSGGYRQGEHDLQGIRHGTRVCCLWSVLQRLDHEEGRDRAHGHILWKNRERICDAYVISMRLRKISDEGPKAVCDPDCYRLILMPKGS